MNAKDITEPADASEAEFDRLKAQKIAILEKQTTKIAPPSFLTVIERLAKNPNINTKKMQAIMDMQEKMLDRNALDEFNQAMNRVQQNMPRVKKNGMIAFTDKNGAERMTPFGKFEDIDKAIRPIYQAEGFSVRYRTEQAEGGAMIFIKVSHIGGHTEESGMRLPLDTSGSKNNLQAMGSTLSYGKRYLICMVFNIVTEGEDNDGAGADDKVSIEQAAEIDNLVNETKSDKVKFLEYMKADSVLDIKSKDFTKALNLLKQKKKAQSK